MRMPRAARGGARCNCVSFGSFRWPPPALALCQIRSFLGPGAMRGSHQSLGGRICVAALICAALSAAADYAVDRDVVRQRPGPWRCSHHHLAASLDQALQTNYSTLGWSADLVAPLMAEMRKCQELVLDQILQRSEYMSPLVTALTASCARPEHEFRLLVVNMDGSLLGDAGIATFAPVLSACTTIESLHALGSRLGDRGALALGAALQLHPKLRVLDLSGNAIGDEGAAELGAFVLRSRGDGIAVTSLTDLRLHDNLIGATGVVALADELRNSPARLESLMLDGNPVGDIGVMALALALRGRPQGTLRRLGLVSTNVSDLGIDALLSALREALNPPPLETITLEGNPGVSEAMLLRVEAALVRPTEASSSSSSSSSTRADVHVLRIVPPTGLFPVPAARPGQPNFV